METDIVQVSYVSVDPEPPKAGQNHTVTVRGTVLGIIEVRCSVQYMVHMLNVLINTVRMGLMSM